MATETVTDHIEVARDFLERSKAYLESGDLHQASEKGWGSAAHMIKAVAAVNDWEYESHDDFAAVVTNARQRYRQPSLRGKSHAAQELHRNYYRRKRFLDADEIKEDIADVEAMIDVLQPFIE